MQISFDTSNPAQTKAVGLILGASSPDVLDALTELLMGVAPLDKAAEPTPSAASVFGGAAPLSDVQLGAGATPLDNAPAGPQGSLPLIPTGMPGLALGGLPAGAQQANAPAGNPAGGVELDSQGIPWHHEIHAGTKSKTQKGEWTKLRGLNDEAKYNRIVAELKALHAMPSPLAPSGPAVVQGSAPIAGMTPAAGTLPQGLPPLAPLQPAANVVPQDFDTLMPRITAGIAAGQLPQDTLVAACTARQLPGIVALVTRPDFVPTIWQDIKNAYPAFTG